MESKEAEKLALPHPPILEKVISQSHKTDIQGTAEYSKSESLLSSMRRQATLLFLLSAAYEKAFPSSSLNILYS